MDGVVILLIIVSIVAVVLYWIGQEQLKTIKQLRKKVEELTSREGEAQRAVAITERDAQNAALEAETHLRPYVQAIHFATAAELVPSLFLSFGRLEH